MRRFFSPNILLIMLVFLTGMSLVVLGFRQYRHHAEMPLPYKNSDTHAAASSVALEELKVLFTHVPPTASQFVGISDGNLFSPERRPWSPPPEPITELPVEPMRPSSPGPSGIRLYGTTITGDRKTALLYFERFATNQKHRLAGEGETVRDAGERGESVYYRIIEVSRDQVVLQDASEALVTIGLYDHQRTAPAPIVGSGPSQVASPRAQSQQHPTQPSSQVAPIPAGPSLSPGPEPIRHLEEMPDSIEEREQLVREGKLRRINTPFGPVYRPVE